MLILPQTSYLELIVRSTAVYGFLLVALRLAGRRELAQMTSFDLVLLLVLSNAVQNSINAGDNSLIGGLVCAVTLVLLNWVMAFLVYRFRFLERVVQGQPIRIVSDGKVHVGALKRERITLAELRSALRKQSIMSISECKQVTLEPDGTLSAVKSGFEPRPIAELAHPKREFEGDFPFR